MDATLTHFKALVAQFTEHQEYIQRARQAGGYSSAAVDRVVRHHREAIDLLIPDLVAAFADAEDTVRTLRAEREDAAADAGSAKHTADLYELRSLIGEMSASRAQEEGAPFRAREARKQPVVDYLDSRLDGYREVLRQWYRVGIASGVLREQAELSM